MRRKLIPLEDGHARQDAFSLVLERLHNLAALRDALARRTSHGNVATCQINRER
jgi:hypothetical protein